MAFSPSSRRWHPVQRAETPQIDQRQHDDEDVCAGIACPADLASYGRLLRESDNASRSAVGCDARANERANELAQWVGTMRRGLKPLRPRLSTASHTNRTARCRAA